MTCAEFAEIRERFFDLTTAERAAGHKHLNECKDCLRWVEDGVAKGISPRRLQLVKLAVDAALEITAKDMQDPEFNEVLR